MIATLNFERRAGATHSQPTLEPGLRRIDEILAVVLERYEAESAARKTPTLAAERCSVGSPEGGRTPARVSELWSRPR